MSRHCFHHPRWKALLAASGAVVSWAVAYTRFDTEAGWIIVFYACFGLVCVAAVLDVMTAFMELGKSSVRIRSSFRLREIPKSEVEKVSWAKGCPVTLRLNTGRVVPVPSFGQNSQGLANSIRAWLNRA